MLNNLKTHKILWLIIGLVAIGVSLGGISSRASIYRDLVEARLIPGTYGQDWISLVAGILLAVSALRMREQSVKTQIIGTGILGYFFYAYGIYVIERVYNSMHLWYMAMFALSFWAIGYALASIKKELLPNVQVSNKVRTASLIVALIQPLVFYPLWIAALLPLMRNHNRIENLYSIYILDLCFIMPAFLIFVYMLARKKGAAYLLTPSIFMLGFALIFSLSVSELVKPVFGLAISRSDLIQSLILSALFIVAAAIHLKNLKINLTQVVY